MTALSLNAVGRTGGVDISTGMTAAANGDTIPAGPNSYLHVKNASAGAITVSVQAPLGAGGGPGGTSITDFALSPTVALTSGDMIYGPFPANPWAQSDGLVHFSYSATASVTVKALQIGAS